MFQIYLLIKCFFKKNINYQLHKDISSSVFVAKTKGDDTLWKFQCLGKTSDNKQGIMSTLKILQHVIHLSKTRNTM